MHNIFKRPSPKDTVAYYQEPYTIWHFKDWLVQLLDYIGFAIHFLLSAEYRRECEQTITDMERSLYGSIPSEHIYLLDEGRWMGPDEKNPWA